MKDKGTWDAVRFVPYKKGESQRVSPTPSPETAPQSGSPNPAPEIAATDQAHYADLPYDEGLIELDTDQWEYHPKNDSAINHILRHCEDTPANKIEGVKSAREAMKILMKHYAISTELEKFLVAEKLWTTTYVSAGDMTKYTDRFADTWKDINRLKIDLEFLVRSLMVHQLGEHYESFQQRKRESGIGKLSIDDLTSQLLEEELSFKRKQGISTVMTTKTNQKTDQKQPRKNKKKKNNSKDKEHDPATCPFCKKEGNNPDDCWFLHRDKAPEAWRKHHDTKKNKDKETSSENAPNYLTMVENDFTTQLVNFTQTDRTKWTLDSSSGPHVCNDASMFIDMHDKISIISSSTGTKQLMKRGTVKLSVLRRDGSIVDHQLNDVVYNPESPINICSLLRMYNKAGCKLDMDEFTVKDPGGKEVAAVFQDDGILIMKTSNHERTFATKTEAATAATVSAALAHRRMGHLGYRNLKQLAKVTNGMTLTEETHPSCECCSKAKLRKRPFGRRRRATRKGEITHMDLVPKITPTGYDGSTGYLSITDDLTTRTKIRLLKKKDEAAAYVKEYYAELKSHDDVKMATIYSDLDGVFTSNNFKAWMASKGITHEPTVHDTPEENGLAEVTQFHLNERARSILVDQNLPKFLWPLALKHAAYLKERSPAKRLKGKTPYEYWHKKKPDISHLKVFGSVAYFSANPMQSEKFSDRGLRGRFVGYDSDSTIHLIWIEGTREIRRERNVEIHEDHEPYNGRKYQEPDLDFGLIQEQADQPVHPSNETRQSNNTPLQRKLDKIQNSPRERELDEAHELNSSARESDVETPHATRSRTGSVINVEPYPATDPETDPETDPDPEPGANPEADPEADPEEEQQTIRRSARSNKGKPRERYDPSLLTTSTPEDLKELASVRNLIALTGAPEEHFHTLFTAILKEVNHAHQSLNSYLDEAMEIAATTMYSSEPSLNDLEPKSFDEAMKRPDAKEWKKATDAEMKQHEHNGTFELVELPPGCKTLDGKWVFKIKRGAENEIIKYKARFVARGFMQQFGIDYDQTYAGVIRAASIRAVFALAALYDHDIIQLDFVTAYLNSHINEEIYMKQPTGYVQKGKEHLVCKIQKGLYGLKQSAREWAKRLTDFLVKIGFQPLAADSCVFVKGDIRNGLTITVYVDDVKLIGGDKQAMKQTLDQLRTEFRTTTGDISYYLGMSIKRDRAKRTITLNQRAYLEKILDRYGYSRKGRTVKTPMITGQRLEAFDGIATESSKKEFAAQLGSVMYAMCITRPDIAFAVSSLAQHTNNPGPEHWTALKRIFFYLRGTLDYSITFGVTGENIDLNGYTDASFAEDPATRRSTGAFIFTLNGGPISWSSKRQPTVALSTTEAEYMAMCQAIKEGVWLRQLLTELGHYKGNETIKIHADNKSAIALGKNPEFHKRSKHIDVQYHYVREQVQSGRVTTPYIPTAQMIADGLTKALSPELHSRLINYCRLNLN